MALSPLEVFNNGVDRSLYLVDLYELIYNQRQRGVRSDWADAFRELMHWNQSDTLERIDGQDCILVLRNPTQWRMKHFEHKYLAELLRSAHIFAVSAMDRYFHDLVIASLLTLLRKNVADVPIRLANFQMCLADVEAAIEHALRSRKQARTATGSSKTPKKLFATRPRTTLKERFALAIHKCTFQSSTEIEEAFALLGIQKIWGKLGQRMSGTAEEVRGRLNKIVHRRNRIVHEGDVRRSQRARSIRLNNISATDTRQDIRWLKKLVEAADRVAQDES